MSKLTTESKNILAEFVGSLMKAYARHGAKNTLRKIQNDPVIKKSLELRQTLNLKKTMKVV